MQQSPFDKTQTYKSTRGVELNTTLPSYRTKEITLGQEPNICLDIFSKQVGNLEWLKRDEENRKKKELERKALLDELAKKCTNFQKRQIEKLDVLQRSAIEEYVLKSDICNYVPRSIVNIDTKYQEITKKINKEIQLQDRHTRKELNKQQELKEREEAYQRLIQVKASIHDSHCVLWFEIKQQLEIQRRFAETKAVKRQKQLQEFERKSQIKAGFVTHLDFASEHNDFRCDSRILQFCEMEQEVSPVLFTRHDTSISNVFDSVFHDR